MTPPTPATPRAKICGLRTQDAARAAVAGGADYLGFNFYPPARRSIAPETARAIVDALRADGANAGMVGLFVSISSNMLETTERMFQAHVRATQDVQGTPPRPARS